MEEALIARLLAADALAALVSRRINWSVRPQGSALPALVLTLVNGRRLYAFDGPVNLVESRVQADAYAADYLTAKTIVRAVVADLGGQRFTLGGVEFQGVFVDAERDFFEGEDPDCLFRIMLDLRVWHTEPPQA